LRTFLAPLRLSLVGGGTDVDPFCAEYGSQIINFAIDTFVRVDVEENHTNVNDSIELNVMNNEGKPDVKDSFAQKLGVAIAQRVITNRSIKVTIRNPVKAGSGLGTSSVMIIATLHALNEYLGLSFSRKELVEIAFLIERHDMRIAGGFQDFYPAIYGGVNIIKKPPKKKDIEVNKIVLSDSFKETLSKSIFAVELGIERESNKILADQIRRSMIRNSPTQLALKKQLVLVDRMRASLLFEDLESVIELVEVSSRLKKQFSPLISNPYMESIEKNLRALGGRGVKISGAGGGGHIFCFFTNGIPADIETMLSGTMKRLPVTLEEHGVRELK
jgi:D-glycero-alpha-D-manno-heptose-7-phosphate kinase